LRGGVDTCRDDIQRLQDTATDLRPPRTDTSRTSPKGSQPVAQKPAILSQVPKILLSQLDFARKFINLAGQEPLRTVFRRAFSRFREGPSQICSVLLSEPEATTGEPTIRRPFRGQPERAATGPRTNDSIRVSEVRLIDEEGNNVGVVDTNDALQRAIAAGMDLVEVSPDADPPVCKILDYGKFKYQEQKKAAEARKKQKTVEVKEIKMRPNIDDHDYDVKMKAMKRFFDEGDKVKVTLRFRGREMAFQQLGRDLLLRVKSETEEYAKVESEPRLEGRQMVMILAPR
jgi:translation initiation factor IF-3